MGGGGVRGWARSPAEQVHGWAKEQFDSPRMRCVRAGTSWYFQEPKD